MHSFIDRTLYLLYRRKHVRHNKSWTTVAFVSAEHCLGKLLSWIQKNNNNNNNAVQTMDLLSIE